MSGSELPLSGLRFSLVGPGRVGRSILAWMGGAGAEVCRIVSRRADPEPAGLPCPVIGLGALESGGEDLLVVAVPDPVLPDVARELARRSQAAVVLHTSGRRGAEVLEPLRELGSAAGSLHPLRAFPEPLPDLGVARETFFAVDGDPSAREMARRLARAWGADHGIVPSGSRNLYHLGATLAAGGVTTVVAVAAAVARARGLPEGVLDGYRKLARGALESAPARDPARGITGPVARGETSYAEQLRELETAAPELVPLILELARTSIRLLDRAEIPGTESREALRRRLEAIDRRDSDGDQVPKEE